MSFQLVPKSVTLNDLERRNGHYFALFQRVGSFRGALCKSSRSLSHLLMSSCYLFMVAYGIGQTIIFSCCGFLWSPYGIGSPLYFCPVSSFFFFVFSSPNLSGRRLDVYHTSTHGVAIV